MATKTSLTIEQYAALEEPAGLRYELSEGELIVTPSPNYIHNQIRDRLNAELRSYLKGGKPGHVVSEMDFKLADDVVRRPDVAFIRAGRLQGVDLEEVPLPFGPDLAVEIVSKNDRADDLLLKVSQYLHAGAQAVWLLYPKTGLAYRYLPGKLEPEVRTTADGGRFEEPLLLPGLSLPLAEILS